MGFMPVVCSVVLMPPAAHLRSLDGRVQPAVLGFSTFSFSLLPVSRRLSLPERKNGFRELKVPGWEKAQGRNREAQAAASWRPEPCCSVGRGGERCCASKLVSGCTASKDAGPICAACISDWGLSPHAREVHTIQARPQTELKFTLLSV